MPQPLLRYQMQLSQSSSNGVTTSLTYVYAGQVATVSVVVANAGADVTIESLTFDFGVFGQNATDLAASAGDIVPIPPSGWSLTSDTTFTITPPGGSIVVGTLPLTFVFEVTVNAVAGACSLAITEVSTVGSAKVYPIAITKMPAAFMLANLCAEPTVVNPASPMLVEPNGTVTLTWSGSADQVYTIGLPGGATSTCTAPSAGTISWVTPAVLGTDATVTYTVSASTQVAGQALTAELSTTLNVDVAQIISFTQPGAFYASPVTLNWQTSNADRCVLFANGVTVDENAPTNPGAAGYLAYPAAQSTQYVLHAYRGTTYVSSAIVFVNLYDWALTKTLSLGDLAMDRMMSLAISRNGTALYYGGPSSVVAYNATSLAVLGTGVITVPTEPGAYPVPLAVANSGLVLSRDGATLYAGIVHGQVLAFKTANLAAAPVTIPVTGGPLAMSADGSTLFVATSQWGVLSGGVVNAVSTTTHSVIKSVTLPVPAGAQQADWQPGVSHIGDAVDMKLSPDGATLYVLMSAKNQGDSPLYAVDTTTFAATQVATAACVPMSLSFDGGTLYCGANAGQGQLTPIVKALAIPGFAATTVATLIDVPPSHAQGTGATITGMGTDQGGGLFVAANFAGIKISGQKYGVALFLVDPPTGTSTLLTTVAATPLVSAIVVNAADDAAYFTNGAEIVVLSSNGGA